MKTEIEDGKTILLFDDVEELKWYYHTKLCRGEDVVTAEFIMNHIFEERDVNALLKRFNQPCRVKER